MQRTKIFRLCCIAIGILAAYAAVEAGLRYYYSRWNNGSRVPFVLFARPFPDPKDGARQMVQGSGIPGVVFELKPNGSFTFFDKPIQTNSTGLLGSREFSSNKPAHTIRIAGIGDSFMFPWQVRLEDTYLYQLGQRIQKARPGTHVETLNFSVPGYNTAIEYAVLQNKVLSYHPDIIILGFVGNDMDMPNYLRKPVRAASYTWFVVSHAVSYIVCGLSTSLCRISPMDMLISEPFKDGVIVTNAGTVPGQYRYMVGFANYMNSMRHIASLTRARNIPVVVATTDDDQLKDSESDLTSMGLHMFWGDASRSAYAAAHTIDPAVFRISAADPHFSLTGHNVTAALLFSYMMQQSDIRHILEQ